MVGFGDFNGDGLADILWRNDADGTITVWQSTGAGFTPNTLVASVGLNWALNGPHYDFV